MKFTIEKADDKSSARAGILYTDHGEIKTPVFMPVGTQGTVKAIHQEELKNPIDANIILGNTYHLYLRPGTDILQKAGGLHNFIGWDRPMLTDSGGYQVYSLKGMRKITEEGVKFQSHIDGSKHFFSPENVMDIQRVIGADIIMAFDECTPYPCAYNYARKSMLMTHRWLDRCFVQFNKTQPVYGYSQTLAPIVQGSTFPDLRKESAAYIAGQNAELNAIGGLSVGEPHEDMYSMTELVCNILPKDKPRYLMGVGLPENILESISLGIDMFDCVLPTRNARHGIIYTKNGVLNMKNAKWQEDFNPIDSESTALTSKVHTRAYLRHLFKTEEMLAAQIASLQNLSFFTWLVREARIKIKDGTFFSWKTEMVRKVSQRL
ncbi:MAG: tRNA guanosine(34) transglycosylase Tgt [Saprospiraceae bacterium]|nr:tRNA guanosine(34) transglycosylase Tgt [Saprospiraceae bacterium]MBK6564874.1 tRNA guanosine(34) transglycosylase Tgt [Saprospiraceae bacterium]MBK8079627.1 tRNA guanosine(34) transglycosylase Tgt [Saprospiraceae bacterium]MBK8371494.1 tRNA guanosine(34) transglycosylase Tgt [Saprospiraceae bacterium]MBK8853658.1 tRNA guanosine(34) transglycosylase Tgt [Saprospiraceae bacterium]